MKSIGNPSEAARAHVQRPQHEDRLPGESSSNRLDAQAGPDGLPRRGPSPTSAQGDMSPRAPAPWRTSPGTAALSGPRNASNTVPADFARIPFVPDAKARAQVDRVVEKISRLTQAVRMLKQGATLAKVANELEMGNNLRLTVTAEGFVRTTTEEGRLCSRRLAQLQQIRPDIFAEFTAAEAEEPRLSQAALDVIAGEIRQLTEAVQKIKSGVAVRQVAKNLGLKSLGATINADGAFHPGTSSTAVLKKLARIEASHKEVHDAFMREIEPPRLHQEKLEDIAAEIRQLTTAMREIKGGQKVTHVANALEIKALFSIFKTNGSFVEGFGKAAVLSKLAKIEQSHPEVYADFKAAEAAEPRLAPALAEAMVKEIRQLTTAVLEIKNGKTRAQVIRDRRLHMLIDAVNADGNLTTHACASAIRTKLKKLEESHPEECAAFFAAQARPSALRQRNGASRPVREVPVIGSWVTAPRSRRVPVGSSGADRLRHERPVGLFDTASAPKRIKSEPVDYEQGLAPPRRPPFEVLVQRDLDMARTAWVPAAMGNFCDLVGDVATWDLKLDTKNAMIVRQDMTPDPAMDNEFPLRDPADAGRVHPRYAGEDGRCHPNVGVDSVSIALGMRKYMEEMATPEQYQRLKMDPRQVNAACNEIRADIQKEVERLIRNEASPAPRHQVRRLGPDDVAAHEHMLIGQYGLFAREPADGGALPTFSSGRILGLFNGVMIETPEEEAALLDRFPDMNDYALDVGEGKGSVTLSPLGHANSMAFANTTLDPNANGLAYAYDKINALFLPVNVKLKDKDGKARMQSMAAVVALDNLFSEDNPSRQVRVDYGQRYLDILAQKIDEAASTVQVKREAGADE